MKKVIEILISLFKLLVEISVLFLILFNYGKENL